MPLHAYLQNRPEYKRRVRVRDLARLPSHGLSVRYPSGEETQIVALATYTAETERWRVLVPAAHPLVAPPTPAEV